jgi:type I restriction enzyme M protein
MVDRVHREVTDEEIQKATRTYQSWRDEHDAGEYRHIPGFCKSATLEKVRQHGYVLTPGRYVGAVVEDEDDEPFEEMIRRLTAELREQMAEARRLEGGI